MSKESLGIYPERERRLRKKFAPLLVTAAAVLFAGCSGINGKESIINLPATATPSTAHATPTPGVDIDTLIKDITLGNEKLRKENDELRKKMILEPTQTPILTEQPTPIPILKLTRTATPPTRTPTFVRRPTPASTPRPTPEAEKIINLLPGESTSWSYLVTNVSGKPEKKAFDYKVQPGNKEDLRLKIRVSRDEQKVYGEGEEITFPQGANGISATINARPGAKAACNKVTLEVYSRDPGSTNSPSNTITFPERICTLESLKVEFTEHRVNKGNVVSDIFLKNAAPVKQKVIYWVPEERCFKAANRHFLDNNKPTSDNIVTIPARLSDKESGVAVLTMITELASGEKATPPKCEVRFERILNYQD